MNVIDERFRRILVTVITPMIRGVRDKTVMTALFVELEENVELLKAWPFNTKM